MLRIIGLIAILGVLTSPLWLALLALAPTPSVRDEVSLSIDDVANAKRLLRENDPRRLRDGERKAVSLSERELNLVLRYALPAGQAARVDLRPGRLYLEASVQLPHNPLGRYLNVSLELNEDGRLLEPGAMSLGRLRLPAWLVAGVAGLASEQLKARLPEYAALLQAAESVAVSGDGLAIRYRWRAGLVEQLKDRRLELMMPPEQRSLILGYYATIERLSRTLPPGTSLARVLGPLFSQAMEQSAGGADAVAEHRALLLALAIAIQGENPQRLAGDAEQAVPVVRGLRVTLRGRRDLARHFAISAGIAAGSGSELADVIGAFKELSDSQGGSGFSFADLLADRAGVVLAEHALGPDAARLQSALAGRPPESMFMPAIDALPEGLQELEFRARYEDIDSEAYAAIKREVESRIASLPLYR